MYTFYEILIDFFERGGPIFVVILMVSFLLWLLILERYWYVLITYPRQLKQVEKQWKQRSDHQSWYAFNIRQGLLADIEIDSERSLPVIEAITSILLLLGLLGTVTGMIAIFDVMSVFSTGNAQGMANGISRALLPTIAGMVTALAGIYFRNDLENRIKQQQEKARDCLHI